MDILVSLAFFLAGIEFDVSIDTPLLEGLFLCLGLLLAIGSISDFIVKNSVLRRGVTQSLLMPAVFYTFILAIFLFIFSELLDLFPEFVIAFYLVSLLFILTLATFRIFRSRRALVDRYSNLKTLDVGLKASGGLNEGGGEENEEEGNFYRKAGEDPLIVTYSDTIFDVSGLKFFAVLLRSSFLFQIVFVVSIYGQKFFDDVEKFEFLLGFFVACVIWSGFLVFIGFNFHHTSLTRKFNLSVLNFLSCYFVLYFALRLFIDLFTLDNFSFLVTILMDYLLG